MRTSVTKIFRFEAAHHLDQHDGKCKEPHGHSYKVEVTIAGPVTESGPKLGMVIDFGDMSTFWKGMIEPDLDHQDLNKSLPFYPTAEGIAGMLYDLWRLWLIQKSDRLSVERVRVWETENSYVEVTA